MLIARENFGQSTFFYGVACVRKVKAKKRKTRKTTGRNTILTSHIAEECAKFWLYGIEDIAIAGILGVDFHNLTRWLKVDKPVKFKTRDINDKVVSERLIGFRTLRDIMKQCLEPKYIERLEAVYKQAMKTKQLSVANRLVTWILEKRMPQKYGQLAEEQRPPRKISFEVKYRK